MAKITILRATKPMSNTKTSTTGDDKVYSGDVYLAWGPKNGLVDYFNIPVVDAPPSTPTTVKTYTYQRRYDGDELNGAKYITVTVPQHETTTSGSRSKRAGRLVVIPTQVDGPNKTGKLDVSKKELKRPLKAYITFPLWFTIIMIDQALGQMLLKNQPSYYILNNRKRPFSNNTTKALFPDCKSGAWVVEKHTPSVNSDETSGPETPTVKSQKSKSSRSKNNEFSGNSMG
jgi:hypothetical protein